MKKISPLLAVALLIIISVVGYTLVASKSPTSSTSTSPSTQDSTSAQAPSQVSNESVQGSRISQGDGAPGASGNTSGEEREEQVKPATDVYFSADEALSAVLKGAKDYDDAILEQFTLPDPNCAWCSEFYTSVRDLSMNPNTPQEQRAYLAEILAISGRTENVQALVDAVKGAPSNDVADLYAEALELTVGKENVVQLLGENLNAQNETLREASVAAITNQGSKLAAELLVKDLKERGDPDAYYAHGIGIGEMIPDEEAVPVLQELVRDRVPGSHLGVKALLNAGLPGLRALFDELDNSPNPEADLAMLKGAGDHTNLDDESVALANQKVAENRNVASAGLGEMIRKQSQSATQDADADADDGEMEMPQ